MNPVRSVDISVWVHDITPEEAEALTDAIADLVCAGTGEGDEHQCERTDWIVSSRVSNDRHHQVVGIDDDGTHHATTRSLSGASTEETPDP